ncbi:MAG: acetyl-CoA carboxylase carboxyl transferase subunit beta [Lactobacillaceae bacterium]|jgi:acetyl-CoA carboxylase carboxyl transferase subunit beta|nr:acetyl-CoA carboxylase carboxyl transferase subunit beta [Lactobacillaceae bacterium]
MRISSQQWLEYLKLSDFESFTTNFKSDFFEFPDYKQKLDDARKKTGLDEAVLTGIASLEGLEFVLAIFEPEFLMGTMSYGVGKKMVNAINLAIEKKLPFVAVTASGGARLQEGIFAVIQMVTIQDAYQKLREANLPSINILADPTMGGVSASFAFEANITAAVVGAQIGFTGKEVIRKQFHQEIPENFQEPDRLKEEGIIEAILKPEAVSTFLKEKFNG